MDEDCDGAQHARARARAAGHRSTCRRWSTMVAHARGQGLRLRAARRRLLRGAQVPGLRQALRQAARRSARRRARRGRRGQARSAGLRAVEGRQAGRAREAWPVAVGRGPAGLAHRVLGDVRTALLGPTFDIHGGGHGSQVPAPRERDRAERGAPTARRSRTAGCTTASCDMDKEKMSKSLGNFFTLREVLDQVRLRGRAFFLRPLALSKSDLVQRGQTGPTPAMRSPGCRARCGR